MGEKCESCKYFKRDGCHEAGDCRKDPPKIRFSKSDKPSPIYPPAKCNGWCGEYKPIEE
jgi:hypothetical protein